MTFLLSKNGLDWKEVIKVNGACNSSLPINYKTIDSRAYLGLSYYRLKQTDFDGEFTYFPARSVFIETPLLHKTSKIHPNPTTGIITIEDNPENFKIYNSIGENISNSVVLIHKTLNSVQLDFSSLASGMYIYVGTNGQVFPIIKQ